eukprot:Awhi_evm2s1857
MDSASLLTKHGLTADVMLQHFKEVEDGKKSLNDLGRELPISATSVKKMYKYRTTLYRESNKQTLLKPELEDSIRASITYLENRGLPFTQQTFKLFVRDVALENGIQFENGLPGRSWIDGFCYRMEAKGKPISFRNVNKVSKSRVLSASKENIEKYFDMVTRVIEERNIPFENFYNLDETGLSLVMNGTRVIASRGSKSVNQVSRYYGEMSKHATLLAWIRSNEKPLTERQWSLVIMDGHDSHYHPQIAQMALENKIELICLPPHCSHVLQPLDLVCFALLKSRLREICCTSVNDSKVVQEYELPLLLKECWNEVFDQENVFNSFKRAGLVQDSFGFQFLSKEKLFHPDVSKLCAVDMVSETDIITEKKHKKKE